MHTCKCGINSAKFDEVLTVYSYRRTGNFNQSLLPPLRCELYSTALEQFDDNIKIKKKLGILTTGGKTMLIFFLRDGLQVRSLLAEIYVFKAIIQQNKLWILSFAISLMANAINSNPTHHQISTNLSMIKICL